VLLELMYPPKAYLGMLRELGGSLVNVFSDRRDAFEKKFARSCFKATARRNRLIGHRAAKKLGLCDQEADAYTKSVVLADFQAR